MSFSVPEQVAEENLHRVLVGSWQLLDQFLHYEHFLLVLLDFCGQDFVNAVF